MNLTARLRAIEAALASLPCPECGTGGSVDGEPTLRWVTPEEADKPCPACGRVAKVIVMRPIRLNEPPATPGRE